MAFSDIVSVNLLVLYAIEDGRISEISTDILKSLNEDYPNNSKYDIVKEELEKRGKQSES